jgi:hypothetical protein
VRAGHEQAVTVEHGTVVEKGQDLRRLEHDLRRPRAGGNLTE